MPTFKHISLTSLSPFSPSPDFRFRKHKKPEGNQYAPVGYATFYPFFNYPESVRVRISQFIIFPPYQRKGHGSHLYRHMYSTFLATPTIWDITVEDPNDEFQMLRDIHDFHMLQSKKAFSVLPPLPVPKIAVWNKATETLRRQWKLSKRQAERMAELWLLSQVQALSPKSPKSPNGVTVDERSLRLHIKKRIWRQNEEVLSAINEEERRQKVQASYDGVIEEYAEALEAIQKCHRK